MQKWKDKGLENDNHMQNHIPPPDLKQHAAIVQIALAVIFTSA